MRISNCKYIYRLHNTHFDLKEFHNGHIIWMLGPYSATKRFLPGFSFTTSFSARERTIWFNTDVTEIWNNTENKPEKWYLRQNLNENSLRFYEAVTRSMLRKRRITNTFTSFDLKQTNVESFVGFKKNLIVSGVGYKFTHVYNQLHVALGWVRSPSWWLAKSFKVRLSNKGKSLILKHPSISNLSAYASMIKSVRPVGVYINKGIRYKQEIIVKKKGKKKTQA